MTAATQKLIEEIKSAPEPIQREVYDFLIFLKSRIPVRMEDTENLLPLAQSAWAGDWDRVEEDAAWSDL